MNELLIKGRSAIKGCAEGIALVCENSLQGWNGIDDKTGVIIEKDHPIAGMSLKGCILVISGGKGSNGWSVHLHAAKLAGYAPAGMILAKIDSRTAAAAAVLQVPAVTDLEEDVFQIIQTGDWVKVDGDNGMIKVIRRERTDIG